MNGCATTSRSGCAIPSCRSLGSRPEVEEPMMTSGAGGRVDRPQHVALEREPLRHALLHEVGPFDRRLDRGGEAEPAARRQRRADEAGEGALGVRDHLADDALRLGAGIVTRRRRPPRAAGARPSLRRSPRRRCRRPSAARSPAPLQPELRAHLGGAEDPRAHAAAPPRRRARPAPRSWRARPSRARGCPRARRGCCRPRASRARHRAAGCGRSRRPRRSSPRARCRRAP